MIARQWRLREREPLIHAVRMDGTQRMNNTHFLGFAVVIGARNKTQAKSSYVIKVVTRRVKVAGNRFRNVVSFNVANMVTNAVPETSARFPDIKLITKSTLDAINDIRRNAGEVVLDMISRFRSDNGGIGYNVRAGVTHSARTRKSTRFLIRRQSTPDKEISEIAIPLERKQRPFGENLRYGRV